jgi:hypothetical protein
VSDKITDNGGALAQAKADRAGKRFNRELMSGVVVGHAITLIDSVADLTNTLSLEWGN